MTTPILDLDEWVAAQAQPEVTVNGAVRWLECFASLIVASQAVNDPPTAVDGDRYIVGPSPTGVWGGHAGQIALLMGSAWDFKTAPTGIIAYVLDESKEYRYTGSAWDEVASAGGSQVYSLHASFDTASLHEPCFYIPIAGDFLRWTMIGEGGPGDVILDIRKSSSAATPPSGSGDSVCPGNEPELVGEHGITDANFTSWDSSVAQGDILQFVVDSFVTFTRIHFQLDIQP